MIKRSINDQLYGQVEAAVLQLLPTLDVKPVGVEGLRVFLLLGELLHAMQKCGWQQNTRLAEAVADVMQRLPDESVQILGTVADK